MNSDPSEDPKRSEIMDRVYADLRRLAAAQMGRERGDHTLQPTALVNEAYLRLAAQRGLDWTSREQVLGLAATAMRRILVDHARARHALRRGGGLVRVPLDDVQTPSPEGVDVLALDEALQRLAAIDDTAVRVVEMRYFGGLTLEQAATALGIGRRSADRAWATARAWLYRELAAEIGDGTPSRDGRGEGGGDGRGEGRDSGDAPDGG